MVHHTRVIHLAEGKLEDEVYGTPRLERVLNRLFDLDKIAAATGESYWQIVARTLQAQFADNAEIAPGKLDELEEALSEIVHDLRRQFLAKGVELKWLEGQTAPVKDIGDFYFSLIAAGAGIPKRILFGSELGELASSQDQSNWFGTVNERQEQHVDPELVRKFAKRMIDISVLPPPVTGDYLTVWPALFEDSEREIAEANSRNAAAAASLVGIGGDPLLLVEIDDDGRVFLSPRKPGMENEAILEDPAALEDAFDDPEDADEAEDDDAEDDDEEEDAA
jgi:hypothetical protein